MLRHGFVSVLSLCCFASVLVACGDDSPDDSPTGNTTSNNTCDLSTLVFETGDDTGHADPFGAKAAGQARAGRIQASQVQPAHGRQGVHDGDFVLVNDKIAIVIEDKGLSDGYGRFGGDILAVDRVGEDGKPLGLSKFNETLQLTSLYMIDPSSVTVINDGSNGEAAVIRSTGTLTALPFLYETFGAAFPQQYANLTAAYDYVLEPGSEKLLVRFGLINTTDYDIDTGLNFEGSWNLLGFFQGSFSKLFLPGRGFGEADGSPEYVGFENDTLPFAYQGPGATPLDFGGIDISGFQVFSGQGMVATPCNVTWVDDHEVIVGEPGGGVDRLGEVVRRVNGDEAWREISGVVTDSTGAPVGGAHVHAIGPDGEYLTRTTSGDDGKYVLHVPKEAVTVVPQKRGYPASDGFPVEAGANGADIDFAPNGFIDVVATEDGTGLPLPVRIQVIPEEALEPTPASYGDPDEDRGRLWQEFAVDGLAKLAVPPGNHRVIVSRGYEWELLDNTVEVTAGETVQITASLLHSVDTTGAMSADFHIHSMYSADSSDPVVHKVKSALADGLDAPVSSEHEWIISFQPIIEMLGAEHWAFGLPSEELTTFAWGHFGVVPINPRPELVNNGAIDWLGKSSKDIFDEVHALPESPALIVNHPSGDSAFSSYFTKVQLDRETGSSDHELWTENFDAIEVFNDSDFESNRNASVADWFALLNAGKTFFAVGSSDSHAVRTSPVGYPRTFMFLGYDDPELGKAEDVRDAILQGNMTIGGGLFMTVEGPDASGPGTILPRTGDTADFTVTVRCPSWVTADTLEIIVNGETVATEPLEPVGAGPAKEFVNAVTVPLPDKPTAWVVFHAKGPGDLDPVHPGRKPFAVSNPVMFQR
ncbi:MAG: CehA/McbA family metallohydrolase [Polyangiaceae bacterium]|nr:CehA/McbA family metallohydrolase [Polyangiaceae bacterium]